MQPFVLLDTGYAALLLAASAGLERLARHTAARAHRYHTAGFTYQPDHDLWTCPRDEPLWPYEVDRQRRLVRYRARPSVCNACPVKTDCTSTRTGREVVRPVDAWPHSEAGRFHRSVSITLTVLAAAFLAAGLALYHRPADLAVAVPATALTGWLLWHWVRDLLRTPSGFPDTAVVRHSADGPETVADAALSGPGLIDLVPPSRRRARTDRGSDRQPAHSRYRSDRTAEATNRHREEEPS